MPKNVKGGPFLIYKHAFCCKITKNSKGDLKIKKFSKKKSHSAEKKSKGDPLVSASFVGYVKKVKNERRDPLETEKKSKKSRTVPKKIERGDSLVPSGFVGYLEKVKNERGFGPFGLSLPWPLGRTWRLRWFQDCS